MATTKVPTVPTAASAAPTINKSLLACATPAQVYNTMNSYITAEGAVAVLGEFTDKILCTTHGKNEGIKNVDTGAIHFACGTNKFVASAKLALTELREFCLKPTTTLDTALKAAYSLTELHGVGVSLWEETPFQREIALGGYSFEGRVEPAEYTKSDGTVINGFRFGKITCKPPKMVSETIVADETIALLDDGGVPPLKRRTANEIAAARRAAAQV